MITVQIPEDRQLSALRGFQETFRLPALSEEALKRAMVLTDNDRICGVGAFEQQGTEGIVTRLFIDPALRKMSFGDGLLRALLNLMERSGVTIFYIPVPGEARGFMAAEGLLPASEVPAWGSALPAGSSWYEGRLPAFFQRPCKGGRR